MLFTADRDTALRVHRGGHEFNAGEQGVMVHEDALDGCWREQEGLIYFSLQTDADQGQGLISFQCCWQGRVEFTV